MSECGERHVSPEKRFDYEDVPTCTTRTCSFYGAKMFRYGDCPYVHIMEKYSCIGCEELVYGFSLENPPKSQPIEQENWWEE